MRPLWTLSSSIAAGRVDPGGDGVSGDADDEMLAINGVGHRKLERFGEAFMDLIIEYCRR